MTKEALLSVIAEWLQEWNIPSYIPREKGDLNPERLRRILAIAGPRRAGNTYFMYQLIDRLLKKQYNKADILFIDFEDYRLTGFTAKDIEKLFEAFYQLTGKYPTFLFLDKVQNIDGWSRLVRTLHNRLLYKYAGSLMNAMKKGSLKVLFRPACLASDGIGIFLKVC
ncbi:ATP-binding protein [Desulfothermus sp.]